MKALLCTMIIVGAMVLPVLAAHGGEAPHTIAGISLGAHIDDYPDIVSSNYLKQVVVTDWHGFRKGVIFTGVCKYPGRILKLNMKYEDKSKGFYKQLLKRFTARFGEPDAWEGDSFGVMYIWKWYFVDEHDRAVSLTLQYNSKNARETIGNAVKLSFPGMIEEELLCFNEMCEEMEASRRPAAGEGGTSEWSALIPR